MIIDFNKKTPSNNIDNLYLICPKCNNKITKKGWGYDCIYFSYYCCNLEFDLSDWYEDVHMDKFDMWQIHINNSIMIRYDKINNNIYWTPMRGKRAYEDHFMISKNHILYLTQELLDKLEELIILL